MDGIPLGSMMSQFWNKYSYEQTANVLKTLEFGKLLQHICRCSLVTNDVYDPLEFYSEVAMVFGDYLWVLSGIASFQKRM